jgi:hypothetical protein
VIHEHEKPRWNDIDRGRLLILPPEISGNRTSSHLVASRSYVTRNLSLNIATSTFFILVGSFSMLYNHTTWDRRFFPWWWGDSSTQAWMPTYVSILRSPQMIWAWRATVEWYIDRGKLKNSEKTCPSATLSTTNPTWIDPGANPGLRSERPVTNDLSHGTATDDFTSSPREGALRIFIALWNPSPLPDFNQRTLGPMASTLTGLIRTNTTVARQMYAQSLSRLPYLIFINRLFSAECYAFTQDTRTNLEADNFYYSSWG